MLSGIKTFTSQVTLILSICLTFSSSSAQSIYNFSEDFSTTDFLDSENTTAIWDTSAQQISLPAFACELLGSYSTAGSSVGVAVSGHTAIIADHLGGIIQVDISDPANPVPVDYSDTPGVARFVKIDGNYCYVADDSNGLVIYRFDPTSGLAYQGTVNTPGNANCVDIAGHLAFVADDSGGLQIIDISDPTDPTITGSVANGVLMRGVSVSGKYAFVANYSTGMTVVDISDPTDPTVVTSLSTTSARGIDVSGNLAFVADYSNGLVIVDITDPTAPIKISNYLVEDLAIGVKAAGKYVYLADYTHGMKIIDISAPDNPTLMDSLPCSSYAYFIDVQGEFAYMVDWNGGLSIIRTAYKCALNPASHLSCNNPTSAIIIDGPTAYVAEGYGIKAVDISDPETPSEISYTSGFSSNIIDMAISGNALYAIPSGEAAIVCDISNLSFLYSQIIPGGDNATAIALAGNVAYLATTTGLVVLDITDPLNPTAIGSPLATYEVINMSIEGGHLYLSCGDNGLFIYDLADPYLPIQVSSPITFNCTDFKVQGRLGFLAKGGSWNYLQIYDLSNPTAPIPLASYSLANQPQDIEISGQTALVSCSSSQGQQLVAVDFSDLDDLSDSSFDLYPSGQQIDTAVYGDYALTAEGAGGLQCLFLRKRDLDLSRNQAQSLPFFHADHAVGSFSCYSFGSGFNYVGVKVSGSSYWYDFSLPNEQDVNFPAGSDLIWRLELNPDQSGNPPTCTHLNFWAHYVDPGLTAVSDVPNDQGRQVRLVWEPSSYDNTDFNSPTRVTDYYVYRHYYGKKADSETEEKSGWDYVTTVPATNSSIYSVVVPTLGDSTITGGNFISTFKIRAMSGLPGTYYDSDSMDGYSLDNLSPSVPGALVVTHGEAGNELTWQPSPDEDFRYFRIYRSTEPDFIPDSGNLVHQCVDPFWVDSGAKGDHYYKVTALDFAGNESEPAATNGSSPVVEQPQTFSMYPNYPNPFNPATTIKFDLPQSCQVTLEVYDVSGHLVRRLLNETMEQGPQTVVWKGQDYQGQQVGSGIYFAHLVAGGESRTLKMTLIQ